MNILHNINPKRITKEEFIVVIEIPQGSKKKYEIDKETGMLLLDRFLTTSFRYPANYGFIPLTHCDDNDPLDVLVLTQESLTPLTLVKCRPLGVIKMIDNYELDEKILAVPVADISCQNWYDLPDIPVSLLDEIKHFFQNYKALEKKSVIIENIKGKQEAFQAIEKSILTYQTTIKPHLKKD
ncbi:inorganic diphosphatase [Candidatus Phytoplasma solani]|uniref:Inorganic pyrophosphatase n=1 Tax=Candidatus Phytoplasma solani TaxID=69896 RepID=A0A421NV85_9MOLU|nr:inorganic diphosphatase [Candidatus Phytoplasma solani]RMI87834.1 inorganic pyrophosphatase [Candidatus Phytoplasma solani]CCP88248.1 Pyrophosphate phospho-hydrolase [Candidatus Phytoplasma solani]CCP88727.1 Inorganic pyrophosphatase [Candidatus Phytoplasma solani]